jgi:hypothetical protein
MKTSTPNVNPKTSAVAIGSTSGAHLESLFKKTVDPAIVRVCVSLERTSLLGAIEPMQWGQRLNSVSLFCDNTLVPESFAGPMRNELLPGVYFGVLTASWTEYRHVV